MNATELPIANPCAADWTTMSLADRGRFCGECRKVVRELARMSEPEARALLTSPPTEGLCVRYIHDASGEIVFRRAEIIPVGRLVRASATVALAIALPFVSAACASTGEPATVHPPTVMGGVMMGAPPVAIAPLDAGRPGVEEVR